MNDVNQHISGKILSGTETMPVLFIGHGSPMNAIEDNQFSRGWREAAKALPRPKAILCISAHWETPGTRLTAMEKPRTIHDCGGFPPELYAAQYPASGSPWLVDETISALQGAKVDLDMSWGLDHGSWSVLMPMFPDADIPVVQLSLDVRLSPHEHYTLAKGLASLRSKGVLILGSGNLVHNLRRVAVKGGDFTRFNEPYGFDWAVEANELFKKLIDRNDFTSLANYQELGPTVQLAVPTNEHYLPILYALACRGEGESLRYFNDQPVAGSLTMTSFVIGG